MKINKLITIFLLLIFSANSQETKWAFDKDHSKIQFDVSHMVISEVSGQFHEYDGIVLSDKEDFSDATVSFTVNTKSIDTDNEKRDGHLRSADFFNSSKYPKMSFKSKKMVFVKAKNYKLIGDFTLNGVTKEIELFVKHGGTVKDPYGNIKAGFKITGTINRTLFGLNYNSVLDSGGLLIGEDISIICKIELIKLKG